MVLGTKPLQYAQVLKSDAFISVQIDVVEVNESVLYGGTHYSHILVVSCLHSHFRWARLLPYDVDRTLILRLLTDIFTQFGVPGSAIRFLCNPRCSEGIAFSTTSPLYRILGEVRSLIEHIFRVEIKEIANVVRPSMVSFSFQQAFDYSTFVRSVSQQAEAELGGAGRWAEALQFTLMSYNQSPHPLLGNDVSPFEVRTVWKCAMFYFCVGDVWTQSLATTEEISPALARRQ